MVIEEMTPTVAEDVLLVLEEREETRVEAGDATEVAAAVVTEEPASVVAVVVAAVALGVATKDETAKASPAELEELAEEAAAAVDALANAL